jgi:hypothetical protein
MLLGTKGITKDMIFVCCDCEEKFTGQQILNDEVRLYFAGNKVFRCDCCQDDVDEINEW